MVDATVTVRMIRALRRIGYTNVAIAEGTGLGHPNVIGNLANEPNFTNYAVVVGRMLQ